MKLGSRALAVPSSRALAGLLFFALCCSHVRSAAAQSVDPPVAGTDQGSSLWNDEAGNRYSNRKAMHVGDLITVLVLESSQGSNSASLKTKKESKLDMQGGPGVGPLKVLPSFGAKSNMKNETDGTGTTSLSGQLNTKITAQVIAIRPNGHLVIEGSRLMSVNGDEDRITLHGVARPEDIRADNTILSTFLAEERIAYDGKGPARNAAKHGLITRLFSWLF